MPIMHEFAQQANNLRLSGYKKPVNWLKPSRPIGSESEGTMRFSATSKLVFVPLLALFLIAGCVAPMTPPATEPGTVTVSVNLPEYRTQNLAADIKTLVFGLADVTQNETYFGFTSDGTTSAPLPEAGTRYHLAITKGEHDDGKPLLSGDGLESGQWEQTKRYLYAVVPDASKLSMSFSGLRESSARRYVAFVAAFGKDAATLTSTDLLGFARTALPFSIVNGVPSEPLNLTLTLDQGLATLPVVVNFTTGGGLVELDDTSRVVVALADMDSSRTPRFGDGGLSNNAPPFHAAIAGNWAGGLFTKGFFDYPFGFPEVDGQMGAYNRFLYADIPTGAGAVTGERRVAFSNVRVGGTYSIFVVALDAAHNKVGGVAQLDDITLHAGDNDPKHLVLPLSN